MADAYTQITADMKASAIFLAWTGLAMQMRPNSCAALAKYAGLLATAQRCAHCTFRRKRPRERYGCGNTLGGCGGVCAHNAAKRGFERIPLQNIFTPAQRDRSLAIGIALARRYLDPIGGVARVHGGGFAGTMQALVPIGAEDGFTRYMESFSAKQALFGQYKGHIKSGCLMGGHKTVNGAYRYSLMPAYYVM